MSRKLEEFGVWVSSNGDIWNEKKKLTSCKCRNGYLRVSLTRPDGKRTTLAVHRAVALAYLANPDNKPDVNHKDGNKENNDVSNLEWVTEKENSKHAKSTGLMDEGLAKITKQARNDALKELCLQGYSFEKLGLVFNISSVRAREIVKGNRPRPSKAHKRTR